MSDQKGKIHPIILSGGSGTRLWPLSRELFPKQFLPLASEKCLFTQTLERVCDDALYHAPIIICNDEHRFLVAEQCRKAGVKAERIILEPVGRNTAPAVAAAAVALHEKDESALLLVLPSDHIITAPERFQEAVKTAEKAAMQDALVTFGITPQAPETGYGYIRSGEGFSGVDGAFAVDKFVEKPDLETARTYVDEGNWSWNSGIFLFHASGFLSELEKFEPKILDQCRAATLAAAADLDFLRLEKESFCASPSVSIDYAVMERTERAVVVPVDMGWSDVGSWSALWELGDKDKNGNVTIGDTLLSNVSGSYIRSDKALTAVIGLDDVIVTVSDDAVLVAAKDCSQDVRIITQMLKKEGREELSAHTTVYRPWGSYQSIDSGSRFQVKRITVNPGARLSLQRHKHRAEHWVVVEGTAKVTKDKETFLLNENQSTYIPALSVHRLENPGDEPLHIIEVQSGDYLGEDDIERLEDTYGRT